jgi:hypothetical protein
LNLDQLYSLDFSEETRNRMRLRDEEKRRKDQEVNAKPNRGIASEKELGEEI